MSISKHALIIFSLFLVPHISHAGWLQSSFLAPLFSGFYCSVNQFIGLSSDGCAREVSPSVVYAQDIVVVDTPPTPPISPTPTLSTLPPTVSPPTIPSSPPPAVTGPQYLTVPEFQAFATQFKRQFDRTVDGFIEDGRESIDNVTASLTALSTAIASITSSQWTTTGSNIYYNTGNVGIGTASPAHLIELSGGAYSDGSTWENSSSREVKHNIESIDENDILTKINELDIKRWSYKAEDDGVTHIGPFSEDFHDLFAVGSSEKSISTVDPSGVALVGIKALSKRVEELEALCADTPLAKDEICIGDTCIDEDDLKALLSSRADVDDVIVEEE